tara:strand:+ start:13197 stop:13340 length:144 start_codon:yes stop_codon:yes gene_type:complete
MVNDYYKMQTDLEYYRMSVKAALKALNENRVFDALLILNTLKEKQYD